MCNTNFIFKGHQNILISQLKKRELNFEERNILSKNFNIKTFLEIVESSKIKIGSKIYHSKIYNRKRNSDSYTITFDKKGITEYGEILYFFQHETQVYARLNIFLKIKTLIKPA